MSPQGAKKMKTPQATKDNYVQKVNYGRVAEMERIAELRKLEEPQDSESYRDPLSLDITTEAKILLSWGGPEDGFKLTFSKEKELLSGVYYRADWGEYQEAQLSEDEAQEVFDFYMAGIAPE